MLSRPGAASGCPTAVGDGAWAARRRRARERKRPGHGASTPKATTRRGGEAESQLANDGEKLAQAKQIIDLALDLAKDCATSYRKASPEVRKMWNRAFFRTIHVRDAAIADFTYEEPFASLLGSHKGSMVDIPCHGGHDRETYPTRVGHAHRD